MSRDENKINLIIDLIDDVELERDYDVCPSCDGLGEDENEKECKTCDGYGEVLRVLKKYRP
jgi:DnaJ-class molecular chaperone